MPASLHHSSTGDTLDVLSTARTVTALQRAYLDAAPRLVGADAYGVCWLDSTGRTASVEGIGVPDGLVADYENLGRDNDPLFGHMVMRNTAVHDRLLFDQRAWGREPLGRFLGDWGFGRCMQAPVYVDGLLRTSLHLVRGPGARPFSERDLRFVELLTRRFEQQLRCVVAERELDRTRHICASLIEEIPMPAVITTATTELVQVNHAADLTLVSYRAAPALWPEYAATVGMNVAAIQARCGGEGRHAARRDREDPGFVVRTSRVEHDDLFLSLFEPPRSKLPPRPTLTPREQMVAGLVADGYTNERIAATLDLSVNTVKAHLKRINRRLGTANRAQVAAWAQEVLAGSRRAGTGP